MLKLLTGLKSYVPGMVLGFLFVVAQVYSDLKLPDLMSNIVNFGIVKGDIPYIIRTGGAMLLFAAAVMACAIAVNLFASRTAMAFGRDLRTNVFTRVESFSLQEFDSVGVSSLITRATNDVQQVQQFVQVLLTTAVTAPFTFFGAAYMAFSKDRALSLVIFSTIPLILIVVLSIMRSSLPLLKSLQEKIDGLNRVVRESLTGIRVVRAYNRGPFEERRFAGVSRDFTDTSARIQRTMGLLLPMIFVVVNVASVAILWVGAQQVDIGATNVGNVMAIMQYSMQTLFAVMTFSIVFTLLPRAVTSANRISEVLEMTPSIADPILSVPTSAGVGGRIEFHDVTFVHQGAEQPTISGVSFKVEPGTTTAIVGSTGSGKTSLMNLLMRFYDPTSGAVLLDGIDISTISQKDVRSHIGYVPQRTFLFSGTIAENIRFGNEDATLDEVVHAAKIAQAHEFIMGLNGGYDAVVSHGGSNLSGGQRQRIAIARALVKKPRIYIFDDSFSALDYKTEADVRAGIRRETADATVVVITQRVASASHADQVIVLEEGRIVGKGTHAGLTASCGVYSEILASQVPCEEVDVDVR